MGEWALWGLCIYAPHFIWGGQCVVRMKVRVHACKCVSGWHVTYSCSVNSHSVSFSLACWASVLEVDLRHAKSNMSSESSNKSTCVWTQACVCSSMCVCVSLQAQTLGASRLRPCCLKWSSVVLIELNEWSRTPLHLSDPAAPTLPPKSRLRRPTHRPPQRNSWQTDGPLSRRGRPALTSVQHL